MATDPLKAQWYAHCNCCGNGCMWFGDDHDELTFKMKEHMKEHFYLWRNGDAPQMPQAT